MAKNYYMPKDDSGKAELLEHLATRLPIYAELLEISAIDVASVQADATAFRYTLSAYNVVQGNARQWTAFKNLQRDGGTGTSAYPQAPNLPAPAQAVPLGIVPRLSGLIARIKTARNYTEAIGQDLSIVGTTQIIDPATWKPVIDITVTGGHPTVQWAKGTADSIEIWADRGDDKGFIAGVSYRFGGGPKEEAPEPAAPVYNPAPAPAPVYTPAPTQAPANDYYLESVHFGFDEDQPLASEKAKMDHFVQVAKANPNDTFKLVGNTDAKGSNAYNDDLSKRRVDNVAAYAESQGVPASQMVLDYKGKTDPASTNDTEEGRADNRRVDIWHHY